ncbi:MAG TPA: ABC transporter permease [Nocardioidaceae bacterium]|nr:ABC transporter permease [Nocardioidaceae bacterium]
MTTALQAKPKAKPVRTREQRAQARSRRIKHLALAVIVFGGWQLLGTFGNPIVFPPISSVVVALWKLLVHGDLLPALGASLRLLVLGFASAFVIATVMGIALGRYRLAGITFNPYVNALYATPPIALVPLILVWFGFGLGGRVVVVFLACFFPMFINTYAGVRDAPGHLIEVARSFGARSELLLLRQVVVPSAVPYILAGVRVGIGRAVVGMAVAEVYLRLGGIGSLIVSYGAVFKTDYVLAAILPLPLLGIGLTKVFARVEGRFSSWRPT